MKNTFDVGDGCIHIQDNPIRMPGCDPKSICLKEPGDRPIILFARAKTFGELLRREVLSEIGAGRVINLLEQSFQRRFVAQGEADGKIQTGALR